MTGYLNLYKNGRLNVIREELLDSLKSCRLCPRKCDVDRLNDKTGFCKTGRYAVVSSYNLHFGEEDPLVGRGGSGTIFFTWCNLGCIYCQNYTISHLGEGRCVGPEELADFMLFLQRKGAHNINFVTPTHVIAQIVESLIIAVEKGLHIPLVYNSGGYDSISTLKCIDGVFDIYMPDVKYSEGYFSHRYSNARDYWHICQEALLEMHRQAGDLSLDMNGIARKGLLVRHLVLPNRIAGSFKVLKFIADNISKETYVNIMGQYYPSYLASNFKELSRRIRYKELEEVVDFAEKVGLHRGFER